MKRDALCFFWTGRYQAKRSLVAGIWENRNANNPNAWNYDPDYGRQARDDGTWKNSSIRLTWQASLRNKFSIWWDEQVNCQSCNNSGLAGGPSATFSTTALAPEADGKFYNPIRMAQANWTSPLTNRGCSRIRIRNGTLVRMPRTGYARSPSIARRRAASRVSPHAISFAIIGS